LSAWEWTVLKHTWKDSTFFGGNGPPYRVHAYTLSWKDCPALLLFSAAYAENKNATINNVLEI
jgi:hypothetical protein